MSSADAGITVTVQEARNQVLVDCSMSSGVDKAVAGSADCNKVMLSLTRRHLGHKLALVKGFCYTKVQ